ncbi:formate dehydrogenase subunit delta [Emcibacter sp. SYSU 3D8]|uniref:formate dehydrogenase subunit delta n=1 Tax=Emcibacter sp. SYSU 3D8 TaxID=3133969 RepID=UPI0031FE6986
MASADIVRMANQIADFFAVSGHDEAVVGIAGHIRNFWDPRMRRELYAHADSGGEDLAPLVIDAVAALKQADVTASAG